MSIPDRFNPLGVPEVLPAGFARLAYLEATGSQYMVTDFIPSNESGIRLDGQLTDNADTIPCGCRNSANQNTRFYAVRPPREIGTTQSSVIGYGWGQWLAFQNTSGVYRDETFLNWRNNRCAQCMVGTQTLGILPFAPIYPAYIFAANINGAPGLLFIGKIWRVAFSQQTRTVHDYVPAIMPDGTPCMYDTVGRMAVVNSGGGAFICGIETLNQLNELLHKLPDVSGQETRIMTIRLADELQTQTIMNHIDTVSLNKNWNIALAA